MTRRGDIVSVPAPKVATGHEQRGHRYAVVLQSDISLSLSTVIVAPLSRGAQPALFRHEVTFRGQRTRVLVDQLKALDRSRIGRTAGRLSGADLDEVEAGLRDVLGLH